MSSPSSFSLNSDLLKTKNVYHTHECGEHCEFSKQTIAGLRAHIEKITRDHEEASNDENTRNKAIIDYLISSKTTELKLRESILQLEKKVSSIEEKLAAKIGNEAQTRYVIMSRIARAALTNPPSADARSYSPMEGLSPSSVD